MSYHDFRILKQSVSIPQVLRHRGLLDLFKTHGEKLVGPCPIHAGDNPNAFVVSLDRNLWYCFSRCTRGGDVVDLVRALDQVSFVEAGDYLASVASLPPPPTPAAPQSRRSQARSRPFTPFTRKLPLDPTADLLRRKAISPPTASLFETGAYRGRGFLQDCVGVRLHDPSGHPLGYAGRRLIPEHAANYGKWKLPPRLPKSSILYGFHRLQLPAPTICVVEDPWSVMRLHQLAIPAVALLGSSLSDAQRHLLAVHPRVVLLLDGDPAGRSAARRIHNTLSPTNDVRVVSLPDGSDPDDLDDDHLANLVRPAMIP